MLYKCSECGYTEQPHTDAKQPENWTCSHCKQIKEGKIHPENLRLGSDFNHGQQLIIKKLTNELKELGKKDEEIKELKELVKTQGKLIEVLQAQINEIKQESELIAQIQQAPPAYKK